MAVSTCPAAASRKHPLPKYFQGAVMLLNLSPLSVEFRFPPCGAIPWRLVVRLSLLMYYPKKSASGDLKGVRHVLEHWH